MTTIASLVCELKSQATALEYQMAMYESGTGGIDVDSTQRCTAQSLAMKISTLPYGPECHAQLVGALHEHGAPFGDSVSIMLDEANRQNGDVARAAHHGKRRLKADGDSVETEQAINAINYFTESDWHVFRDKSILIPMKLATAAARLRRWGVKHLSQSSRRYPVAIILGCHFGVWADKPSGHQLPANVTYKQLYDWTVLLGTLVKSGSPSTSPFTDYIPVYDADPFLMTSELVEYASSGESMVEGELEHWSTLCACVPLRSNAKLITDEVAQQKCQRQHAYRPHDAAADGRVNTEINACAPGVFGLPQLTWHSDPADRAQPNDRSAMEPFRPKLRRFVPPDAANQQSEADNDWSGERWQTPAANKWADSRADWGHSAADWRDTTPAKTTIAVSDVAWPDAGWQSRDGEWQQPRDDCTWNHSRGDWVVGIGGSPPQPHNDNHNDGDDKSSNHRSRVEQYEHDALTRMRETADKKGKRQLKRPAAAASVLKRPASAAWAGDKDTDDAPLPKVNIKEIMQRSLAESCTKDAFLRRGWAIGQKVAAGKGIKKGSLDEKRYTKAGYENAKTYLQSIGVV
jgi:hypothetical protein